MPGSGFEAQDVEADLHAGHGAVEGGADRAGPALRAVRAVRAGPGGRLFAVARQQGLIALALMERAERREPEFLRHLRQSE